MVLPLLFVSSHIPHTHMEFSGWNREEWYKVSYVKVKGVGDIERGEGRGREWFALEVSS
jgi:hypothetical protein